MSTKTRSRRGSGTEDFVKIFNKARQSVTGEIPKGKIKGKKSMGKGSTLPTIVRGKNAKA
jgi:hypothetical protein